jgi:hypothetical protein
MTIHVQPSSENSQGMEKPGEMTAPANDQKKPAPVQSPVQPAPAKR